MRAKLQTLAQAANRPGALFAAFDTAGLIKDHAISPLVLEYFATCVPVASLDLPFARILSGSDIYSENRTAIPSLYCAPHGFVTVATDGCGDAFALDITEGHVYLISHEKYEDDGIHPGWNSDHTGFLPQLAVSRHSIIETAEEHWHSIEDFLDDFVNLACQPQP